MDYGQRLFYISRICDENGNDFVWNDGVVANGFAPGEKNKEITVDVIDALANAIENTNYSVYLTGAAVQVIYVTNEEGKTIN